MRGMTHSGIGSRPRCHSQATDDPVARQEKEDIIERQVRNEEDKTNVPLRVV